MNSRNVFNVCGIAVLFTLFENFLLSTPVDAQLEQPRPHDGMQVLTRGPIHEAFAEIVVFDARPGTVVPKMAPPAIEELPPSQTPEGDNIVWIPGYWAWDDERDDFLWVSGIWRALPPGRQWVPGYWNKFEQGFQWTSGYWADASVDEVEYLPAPPATAEVGPNIAAPSVEHIWAPGCWVWNQGRYMWRPGYWVPAQENWVWVPAHYVYSPQGYVFVDNYYDYNIDTRGVLFAPVYFDSNAYAQQGFSYRPSMAINLAVIASQLFLRPNYNHYYFGDYYGSNYSSAGYYPPFSFNARQHGYDPFYAHQRWQNRQNKEWANSVQADFQHRADHENARPPRTLAAQQALKTNGDPSRIKYQLAATSLENLAQVQNNPWKFRAVTKEEQQKLAQHGLELHKVSEVRQSLEAQMSVSPAKLSEPSKGKLPKSPFIAKPSEQIGKNQNPPKIQGAPRPDPKQVPQSEPKPAPKIEPKTAPKIEPKPAPKVEPKTAPRVEPKTAPKVEPKPAPKVEPKPAPKVEPKPAPKVEPKPAPRVEPKPAPRVEPKPAPRVEPKPAPRVEPKPAPRVEPKPAPRVEPKPAPKVEPKPNPKREQKAVPQR